MERSFMTTPHPSAFYSRKRIRRVKSARIVARLSPFAPRKGGRCHTRGSFCVAMTTGRHALSRSERRLSLQFPVQKGPCIRPEAVGSAWRYAHDLGGVQEGKACEIAEVNQVRGLLVFRRQRLKGGIQRDEVFT